MTITLFPCGTIPCACPECTRTVYDVIGTDHAGTRIGRLVYLVMETYDVSATLEYLVGGVPYSISLSVLDTAHKICLSQNASSSVVNGTKFYSFAVPVGADLHTVSITSNPPTTGLATVTLEIKACENGLQAPPEVLSTECWSPIVTTVATACGAAATSCSTPVLVKSIVAATTGCNNTNWPAQAGVSVYGKFYAPCTGVDVDTSNAVKSMAGTRTCSFSVLPACVNANDPAISFGFSGTIVGPTGSVSVSGTVAKTPAGPYSITISSAINSASAPSIGSSSYSSCSLAPACPADISQDVTAEIGSATIPCSSSRLIVKASAHFSLGKAGGFGGIACCLCKDTTMVGGGGKSVSTGAWLTAIEIWVGP